MLPILLIHGYSAESAGSDPAAIAGIYGTLPQRLKAAYGNDAVFEMDVSRYVTLDDGVSIDDLSRAMDNALRTDYENLLASGFHIVIHSTGALVTRNWIRTFMPAHAGAPLKRVVYLAGALLGSGWAHIGKGQVAKWGRMVFQHGAERGMQVLNALEFASSWTIDLQSHFVRPGVATGVREAAIIGTQADVKWYEIPIRYAKEDGSDGVVRVAAGNPNYNLVVIEPTAATTQLKWDEVKAQVAAHTTSTTDRRLTYYEVTYRSFAGEGGRAAAPIAIAYDCSHFGDEMGIVSGTAPQAQVFGLIQRALDAKDDDATWAALADDFARESAATYAKAQTAQKPPWWKKWISEPRGQYDHHAQLIVRVRDQDGRPVPHFDVYFNSDGGDALPIGKLFEDKHVNDVDANCICFYLRIAAWDGQTWADRRPRVGACSLEVMAVEPQTKSVQYLPLDLTIPAGQLAEWVKPDQTTLVDITLLRVPAPELFIIATA